MSFQQLQQSLKYRSFVVVFLGLTVVVFQNMIIFSHAHEHFLPI
jgi:hypothetical protein